MNVPSTGIATGVPNEDPSCERAGSANSTFPRRGTAVAEPPSRHSSSSLTTFKTGGGRRDCNACSNIDGSITGGGGTNPKASAGGWT